MFQKQFPSWWWQKFCPNITAGQRWNDGKVSWAVVPFLQWICGGNETIFCLVMRLLWNDFLRKIRLFFETSDRGHPVKIIDFRLLQMAGTRLVYGDGLDDLKDCFAGTFGIGSGSRGHGGGGASSSTRSSRQRVYGGDHYVHPHHLRDSNQGCCDCLEDFGESCSKTRLGMTVLFLWVIILTIVCIALGSNIGKNTHLSYKNIHFSLAL